MLVVMVESETLAVEVDFRYSPPPTCLYAGTQHACVAIEREYRLAQVRAREVCVEKGCVEGTHRFLTAVGTVGGDG